MYCKECGMNWNGVKGARHFVNERAVIRDSLCMLCPECREPEAEKDIRTLATLVSDEPRKNRREVVEMIGVGLERENTTHI